MRRMAGKARRISLALAGLLIFSLMLVACSDSTATPAPTEASKAQPSVTAAQTQSSLTAGNEATATPVIFANPGNRPTFAPTNEPVGAVSAVQPPGSGSQPSSSGSARPQPSASVATGVQTSPAATQARPSASPAPSATSVPVKPLTGYPGKLSIVGNDLYVYVSRFDGKPPQLLLGTPGVKKVGPGQDDEVFLFPTWSKDGKKLAAMSLVIKGGVGDVSSVYVAAADGSEVYKVQDGENVTPIYLSWSPDSNFLTVLTARDNAPGYDLRVADTSKGAAGAKAAGLRTLYQSSPLYSSWSPDSNGLLLHGMVGGNDTIVMLKAKDNKATPQGLKYTGDPGSFRAPAWSFDGNRLAISTTPPGAANETIVIQGKDGATQGAIDVAGGFSSFSWSPTEAKLAHSSHTTDQRRTYVGLFLSDLTGADAPKNGKVSATRIVDDLVLAYFWSPDGKKLAYVSFNNDPAKVRLVWNVYDLATKKSTVLTEWLPTDNTLQVINFFDQYAQSDSVWSPDSKAIVFGGWLNDAINQRSQPQGESSVYVLPVEGPNAGQPQLVGPGALAFWSK